MNMAYAMAPCAAVPPASDDGSEVDLSENNRLPELCAEYLAGRAEATAGTARSDAAKAEVLTLIGSASRVRLRGGFAISAGTVKATDVAFRRNAFRNLRITLKEGTSP